MNENKKLEPYQSLARYVSKLEGKIKKAQQMIRDLRDSDNHICPCHENVDDPDGICTCHEYDAVIDILN